MSPVFDTPLYRDTLAQVLREMARSEPSSQLALVEAKARFDIMGAQTHRVKLTIRGGDAMTTLDLLLEALDGYAEPDSPAPAETPPYGARLGVYFDNHDTRRRDL